MGNVISPSATTVAHFLAKHMVNEKGREELAEAICEVEVRTQIKGASFIIVHLGDPQWEIATSGIVDLNPEGLLPEIEVEFPEHSGWLWLLCACEVTNDLAQPNLRLTFEDKIVRELKNRWGSKRAAPGFNIRANFIKELVGEPPLFGEAPIRFICPSATGAAAKLDAEITAIHLALKVGEEAFDAAQAAIQAVSTVLTPEGEAAAKATANKTGGISAGAGVTVKGVKADSEQLATINEVMGIANGLKAGQLATEALIVACIVESEFRPGAEGGGLLQFEGATAKGLNVEAGNVGQQVDAVLNDPGASGKGGMISLAKAHPTYPAWKIAQEEQASGAGASSEGASNYGPWVKEAQAIITAYGGVKATAGGSPTQSKQGEVARGTTTNPDENSWDCIERLAGAVNWFAFTNGHTFYYMNGLELAQQKPSLYIDVPANTVYREDKQGHRVVETGVIQIPANATYDQTTLEYLQDHKVKGRTQRRSRTSKPQSPSEIRLNLICEPTAYRAGEVFFFINSGPLNGRQIITDTTRLYIKDKFTQFLLEPPTAPIPENEEGTPAEHASVPSMTAPEGGGGYSRLIGPQATYAGPDQGLDFTGGPAPVYALDSGVVTRLQRTNSGWPGEGALMVYELTAGQQKGRFVYTAEDFAPSGGLGVGSKLEKGRQIGEATGSGRAPGIETGFAQNKDGQAYGNTQEGKGGNPPDPEALAFKAYVEGG